MPSSPSCSGLNISHMQDWETPAVKVYSFEEVLSLGRQKVYPPASAKSEDVCTIMYTSGTTGVPKAEPGSNEIKSHKLILPVRDNHVSQRARQMYVPLQCEHDSGHAHNVAPMVSILTLMKWESWPSLLVPNHAGECAAANSAN